MKKTFILDTNVLLYDPKAIYSFEDNDVIIPIPVIRELDHKKSRSDEVGANARAVIRELQKLRGENDHQIENMLLNEQGGKLSIVKYSGNEKETDQALIDFAKNYSSNLEGSDAREVILVTNDQVMQILAEAENVKNQDFLTDKKGISLEGLLGRSEGIALKEEELGELYQNKSLLYVNPDLIENQYLLVRVDNGPSAQEPSLVKYQRGKLNLLDKKISAHGIHSKNPQQAFLLDACLDKSIQLVSVLGKAGTGKTLLALAAGLYQTVDRQEYDHVIVVRPMVPVGRDIGFLPGEAEEKILPYYEAIFDALSAATEKEIKQPDKNQRRVRELLDLKIIDFQPVTFMRGRSIPRTYFIVDEAQNLTPHELQTVLTRPREGCKIIVTGDPYQVDEPSLDETRNGLVNGTKRLISYSLEESKRRASGERSSEEILADIFTYVPLKITERSKMARLVAAAWGN